jgi:hypothetical protein
MVDPSRPMKLKCFVLLIVNNITQYERYTRRQVHLHLFYDQLCDLIGSDQTSNEVFDCVDYACKDVVFRRRAYCVISEPHLPWYLARQTNINNQSKGENTRSTQTRENASEMQVEVKENHICIPIYEIFDFEHTLFHFFIVFEGIFIIPPSRCHSFVRSISSPLLHFFPSKHPIQIKSMDHYSSTSTFSCQSTTQPSPPIPQHLP